MKRLLIVGLVGFVNLSYALWGFGSPVDKTIDEAKQLIKEIESFSAGVEKKLGRQGVSPAVLKQDLQKAELLRSKLTNVTSKVRPLLVRALPGWIPDLVESYKANLAGIDNFQVKDVYSYLQKTLMPAGKPGSIQKLSASQLKEKITAYRKQFPNDKKMRQTEFFFANDFTKEEFDAYLKGEEALKKLVISNPVQKKALEDIFPGEIARASGLLDEVRDSIKELTERKIGIEYPEQYDPNRFDVVR